MSDKIELCANCGRPYREHVLNTWCFEGQEGRWFPGSIAEAIVASRQQAPQVIYGTKGEIPEDLRELYEMAASCICNPCKREMMLIERIARAEGSLRQAGFTTAADGFLWIPPVNEMATKYYSALNEIERLKAYLNPIQLDHFELTKKE